MKTLLEMREKLKIFLSKYDIYIYPVLKFIHGTGDISAAQRSCGLYEEAG